jgi:hypothetical protein
MHVEGCPDIGPQCASRPQPTPYVHHVELQTEETDLDATYGIARWLAVELRFPLRVVHENPTYFALDGTPLGNVNDTHHRRETLVGPGDPWLVARVGAAAGRFVTAARVGVTVPLGSTVPDPYVLGREGLPHEHIQFGTGTVVPVVGGGIAWDADWVQLSLAAMAFFNLYADGYGYRAPSHWFLSTRATVPILAGTLRPYLGGDLVHEGREVWQGLYGEESYALTDLLLGGGLAWRFAAPWSVEASVRFPVVHETQGANYGYPALFQLGFGTSFDLLVRDR